MSLCLDGADEGASGTVGEPEGKSLGLCWFIWGPLLWESLLLFPYSLLYFVSIMPSVSSVFSVLVIGLLQWWLLSCTGPGSGPSPRNCPRCLLHWWWSSELTKCISYFSVAMRKIPWPKATYRRIFWAYSSKGVGDRPGGGHGIESRHGIGTDRKLRAHISTHTQEGREQRKLLEVGAVNPYSSPPVVPARLEYLPSEHHQLGTMGDTARMTFYFLCWGSNPRPCVC